MNQNPPFATGESAVADNPPLRKGEKLGSPTHVAGRSGSDDAPCADDNPQLRSAGLTVLRR